MSRDTKYCVYYNGDSHIVSNNEVIGNKIMSTVLFSLLGGVVKGLIGALGLGAISNFGIDFPSEGDKIKVDTTIHYNVDRDRFEYHQVTYHYRPKASGGYKRVNTETYDRVFIAGSSGYAGLYSDKHIRANMNL